MLIDVLTQQRHGRNVTQRKSYNRAIIEKPDRRIRSNLLKREAQTRPPAPTPTLRWGFNFVWTFARRS
jgi:hypothetical protein